VEDVEVVETAVAEEAEVSSVATNFSHVLSTRLNCNFAMAEKAT
jgi:hypothetical protein